MNNRVSMFDTACAETPSAQETATSFGRAVTNTPIVPFRVQQQQEQMDPQTIQRWIAQQRAQQIQQ